MARTLRKKIAMIGAFGVGKTSLVGRFVNSMFSDKYHTTVGVKIDKKSITLDGTDLTLMIWDLAGEDSVQQIQTRYLKGTSGYLLVADGTRRSTVEIALDIDARVRDELGNLPKEILLNKSDLADAWELVATDLVRVRDAGLRPVTTSALSGVGVEDAFRALGRKLVSG